MKRLVVHFENKPSEKQKKEADFLNNQIKKYSPYLEGSFKIKRLAKITVVALQVNNDEGSEYHFGISRYSENDTNKFSKEEGVRNAEWRAFNYPVVSVRNISDSMNTKDIINIFHGIAHSLNQKFMVKSEAMNLAQLPNFEGTARAKSYEFA